MRTQSFLSLVVLFSFLFSTPVLAKDESAANINLVLLTDLSGSMKQFKLVEPTQQFLGTFVENLYSGDRVILADFGTDIRVNNPLNVSERNQAGDVLALKSVIDGYDFSQNFTYTSGALDAACLALNQQVGPKVLVLLTDGIEEIPDGSPPLWDQLPEHCSGIAIHVVALTNKSMPTVKQVGDRLHATVHDATKQTLAEIGEDIRKNIRVFVETVTTEFKLGNLTLGSAAEMRTEFKLTGASSQIELKPVGDFPDGVEFTCANFTVPGEMRCQLTLVGDLKPGNFSGSVSFESTVTNLAVVTPKLQVEFSRGLTNITASEDDISLDALRPGESTLVSMDFESNEPMAQPETITLTLSGFPADVVVTLEPSTIQVPSEDVQLTVTFVSGNPGTYSGQLAFSSQNPTVTVSPAVIPLSFHRRTWYWENWMFTLPGTVLALLFLIGLYFRKVVIPRREAALKPYLKGRIEYQSGSSIALDTKLQEQEIDGFKFRATGTSQKLTLQAVPNTRCKVRRMRDGNTTLMPNVAHNLKDGDQFQTREGEALFTFHCLGL